MKWEFDKEGEMKLTKANNLPQIKLTSGNTTNYTHIEQYDREKPHKTLGALVMELETILSEI